MEGVRQDVPEPGRLPRPARAEEEETLVWGPEKTRCHFRFGSQNGISMSEMLDPDRPGVKGQLRPVPVSVVTTVAAVTRGFWAIIRWRTFSGEPRSGDPCDDMVIEVAVAGGCQFVVAFNVRDFKGADHFGPKVGNPGEFLSSIGALP